MKREGESLEAKVARIDERTLHLLEHAHETKRVLKDLTAFKWKATGAAICIGAICSLTIKIFEALK